jgi:hypothetical protein
VVHHQTVPDLIQAQVLMTQKVQVKEYIEEDKLGYLPQGEGLLNMDHPQNQGKTQDLSY